MAQKFLELTDVDALMIGRGSMGNPEIFKQIAHFLKEGSHQITENSMKKMREYIKLYEQCVNTYLDNNISIPYPSIKYKFMELRRNLIWFSKNVPNSTELRIAISKTKNLEELDKIINSLN